LERRKSYKLGALDWCRDKVRFFAGGPIYMKKKTKHKLPKALRVLVPPNKVIKSKKLYDRKKLPPIKNEMLGRGVDW
jgi:hypothetical protein